MTMDNNSQIRLSIISTSCDVKRLSDIIELLESVQAQTYGNIETVFVVERSAKLFEQVKENVSTERFANVNVLFKKDSEGGISSAWNLGVKHASGDILAFVNDDVVLSQKWAQEIVETFVSDDSIIGITGSCIPRWQEKSLDWFPKELYWIISCTDWYGLREIGEVRNLWGMNMAVRREAFDIGGYFPTSIGSVIHWQSSGFFRTSHVSAQETVFSLNLKKKTKKRLIFNPKVQVEHKVQTYRLTLRSIAMKSYQIGCERRMIQKLFREGDKGKETLWQEYAVLGSIFGKLLPNIVKQSISRPLVALRQFRITLITLLFVFLGYFLYELSD
jgi:glycosyltransferase involved in cell wall biosynthesis